MTSTSGPGISLMAELTGYAYFTEIPTVIFDVQRVGPSTGMPTRTSQGGCYFGLLFVAWRHQAYRAFPRLSRRVLQHGYASF